MIFGRAFFPLFGLHPLRQGKDGTMQQPPYRRKQYLINKPFQFKIMLYLSVLVVIAIGLAHLMAWSYAKLVASASSAAISAQPAAASAPGFTEGLWLPVMVAVLLGIVAVLIFGLFYSHRIAGPMFALKRVLQRVQNGDLGTEMHIRVKDEFHDVEAAFNQMVSGLNQKMNSLRQAILALPGQDPRRLNSVFQDHFTLGEHTTPAVAEKTQTK
jgi:HAMP domain-containing protein